MNTCSIAAAHAKAAGGLNTCLAAAARAKAMAVQSDRLDRMRRVVGKPGATLASGGGAAHHHRTAHQAHSC